MAGKKQIWRHKRYAIMKHHHKAYAPIQTASYSTLHQGTYTDSILIFHIASQHIATYRRPAGRLTLQPAPGKA
jgi:hypothetical protein